MLLFLLGCLTAQDFPQTVAGIECSRREECFPDEFGEQWADQSECVVDKGALYDKVSACYAEYCTFDERGASEFLSAVRNSPCADVEDALGEYETAYVSCTDDTDRLSCLASAYF